MKKLSAVAVALLLAASSSFAAWDYFPPKESGGEVKLGLEYGIPEEKTSTFGLSLGARYTIIEGLEASVKLPMPMMLSYDGESAEDYAGLSHPVIGVRYWLPMGLGFFLDFKLPVDTREGSEYWTEMAITVGPQYSMNFTEELAFGSQLGLEIPFANGETKLARGMDLLVGLELDYTIGIVTPFLGVDLAFGITDASYDGESIDDSATDMGVDLIIGAAFNINEMFGADVSVKLGFGERYGEDNMPVTIGGNFAFKF